MSYRHRVRVRYVDCDMQGVVYNAHYLTFVDVALDTWLRELDPRFESLGWELMVKVAHIEWHGPAALAEVIDLDVEVRRWGTTSFDTATVATVDGRSVFEAAMTYVVVDAREHRPLEIPDELRGHLGP